MKNDTEFLTPEEAAKYLRVNKRTIYRWVRDGKVPCRRAGKQWRFSKDELDRWSKKQAKAVR
ncbi:MAG: helix-turn-helix domain-containing protein [Candidatus Omnitrophica bacterium]|nr:helix-turn-helix domain-containing protein [Candidatus Omnitrophota bacterium]